MTPVKNPSGLQVGIPGLSRDGEPITLYISNEVTGKIHIAIGEKNIFFDQNLLTMAYNALYPVEGVKHGGTL